MCSGFRTHLPVSTSIGSLAGGAGPVAVMGMPVAVVMTIWTVTFLVHGAVVVVVMMVVATVLGPATVPFAILRWSVT